VAGNPRWAMMVKNAQRMDKHKVSAHLEIANAYLKKLSSE